MQNSSEAKTRDIQLQVREALSLKKEWSQKELDNSEDDDDNDDEAMFDARMRRKILQKQKEMGDRPSRQKKNGTMNL